MLSQIADKALEIARKRRQILGQMREAIRTNDRELVFELARKLTGVSDEECNRADSRIN
jgi:hypothetical protein